MKYEPAGKREDYPSHQLIPLKGGRYTDIIHGPPGTEIGDLYTEREPYVEGDRPAVVTHSGWTLDDDQLQYLKDGGHIRLAVFQHPIPPLAVSVEPPVCDCHTEPMNWSPEDGFHCAHQAVADGEPTEAEKAEADVRADFKPGETEVHDDPEDG